MRFVCFSRRLDQAVEPAVAFGVVYYFVHLARKTNFPRREVIQSTPAARLKHIFETIFIKSIHQRFA